MPGKPKKPEKIVKGGELSLDDKRYIDRLMVQERRRAYQEGLELAIAMAADPKDLKNAVKELAKTDAAAVISGRTRGQIVKPGLLWGERKTVDETTADLFEQTLSAIESLENLKVQVSPRLSTISEFVNHMHLYSKRTPKGRTFKHMKVSSLGNEYKKVFEEALKNLPKEAPKPDRSLVDKLPDKPKPKQPSKTPSKKTAASEIRNPKSKSSSAAKSSKTKS